ncbi:MAG: alcohol dehydrogenase catalytic domain-containing protein [Streptosporangiaceae bacterium]
MMEVIGMRAAVLTAFGKPLEIQDVADPDGGGGEVVVEVLATCVLPYAQEVFSGARNYPLEPPVVPGLGGVCRVVRPGPDATKLSAGDLVWCDSMVRSRGRCPDARHHAAGLELARRGRREARPVPARRVVRRAHAGSDGKRLSASRGGAGPSCVLGSHGRVRGSLRRPAGG